MKIGIPKEIKNNENRVGLSPSGVHALVDQGHEVLVETNAGLGSYLKMVIIKKPVPKLLMSSQKLGMLIWSSKSKNHLNQNTNSLKKS